ncbi:MAG: hypothetical protein JWR06_1202, partial [Jatrophihabitans sp.]|nr:hypothetical protein [Jatrophihabitans sp.]
HVPTDDSDLTLVGDGVDRPRCGLAHCGGGGGGAFFDDGTGGGGRRGAGLVFGSVIRYPGSGSSAPWSWAL